MLYGFSSATRFFCERLFFFFFKETNIGMVGPGHTWNNPPMMERMMIAAMEKKMLGFSSISTESRGDQCFGAFLQCGGENEELRGEGFGWCSVVRCIPCPCVEG